MVLTLIHYNNIKIYFKIYFIHVRATPRHPSDRLSLHEELLTQINASRTPRKGAPIR